MGIADHVDQVLKEEPLVQLVQQENFVGWVYDIDYGRAKVLTNDLWKAQAMGIPHNCFLVAASFNPEQFSQVPRGDQEVILLRVVGSAALPQDDDLIRTKIDNYQQQTDIYGGATERDFDDLTYNQLQFGGLECTVLGTFFVRDTELWLGSDLESFATAARLSVYRPRGIALEIIVNHVDPLRKKKAIEDARELGIDKPIDPFPVGTVRYTSTDRLHRSDEEEFVPVRIQPSDFLARRTAVLGMTRTGKSNMIKQTVSVVKRVADEGGVPIGQVIYDINGEYANANQQDEGAIADVYPEQTVRYRMLETPGFEELQNNFYVQLNEGFAIIRRIVEEEGNADPTDVSVFLNTSFDEPDNQYSGEYKRWQVRTAAYQTMLDMAGFAVPSDFGVRFEANQDVRAAVEGACGENLRNPKNGLSLSEARKWLLAARKADQESRLKSSSGKHWLDDDTKAILNMMAQRNENETFIKGYKVLVSARPYHSPRRSQEVGLEIYEHLKDGKIVILDLSVGEAELREKISKQIARDIFRYSMNTFLEGDNPPNIVVYVEEAHNLLGRKHELTDTWPRLAKEGAKYRIALVYATQEVSSIHPNILANSENWFITHLNNERELRELARFYDFADFTRSLLRAQDVGFARIKTLSGPFVIPVQIDRFELSVQASPEE